MPAERVTMRKIKDMLRLKWGCGLSNRQVAASCGVARSTVAETLYRATAAGVSWPLPEDLDDQQLETRLYPAAPSPTGPPRAMPEWATVHQELTRKGVTLALLWQEYKAQHPDGYQYSRFCDLYGAWRATLDRCLRQEHRAGEKLFVDYAGQTVPVQDRRTGNCGRPRSSSPSWARRTTPTPRRPGRKRSPIGSVPMSGPSPILAACRRSSCPITYGAA